MSGHQIFPCPLQGSIPEPLAPEACALTTEHSPYLLVNWLQKRSVKSVSELSPKPVSVSCLVPAPKKVLSNGPIYTTKFFLSSMHTLPHFPQAVQFEWYTGTF